MASATVTFKDAPIHRVTLTMTESEARYLLDWIESHSGFAPEQGNGPVTSALREALR